ncbi:hypothetical protein BKA57DRAFT_144880 [Linnemannia elongata]|nr:hypothetical protein BKA57DRAFT_144880 [Linnemannia elongata]
MCCIERLTTNVFCTLLSLSVLYPVGLGMNAWTRLLLIADVIGCAKSKRKKVRFYYLVRGAITPFSRRGCCCRRRKHWALCRLVQPQSTSISISMSLWLL